MFYKKYYLIKLKIFKEIKERKSKLNKFLEAIKSSKSSNQNKNKYIDKDKIDENDLGKE